MVFELHVTYVFPQTSLSYQKESSTVNSINHQSAFKIIRWAKWRVQKNSHTLTSITSPVNKQQGQLHVYTDRRC